MDAQVMFLREGEVNQLAERYDAGLQAGKLLIQQCDACGKAIMYPRWRCPFCFSDSLSFVEAQGTGTLYSMTVQHLTAPTRTAGGPATGWTARSSSARCRRRRRPRGVRPPAGPAPGSG